LVCNSTSAAAELFVKAIANITLSVSQAFAMTSLFAENKIIATFFFSGAHALTRRVVKREVLLTSCAIYTDALALNVIINIARPTGGLETIFNALAEQHIKNLSI